MYEQFLVTYKAEYEIWAESKEQAIAQATEEHKLRQEGGFEAVKIDESEV